MPIDWMTQAETLREELVARRRDLHRHPELAFEEVRTAGIVANELNALGLEVTTGVAKTGVVGILEGQHSGPTVMLRCDMDALPVQEANQTDYVSGTPGKMHACGHDGHTAIGLGVAKLLSAQREHLAGRVKFVFQPAEEIARGAQAMIDDGALANPTPDVCLGLHLWNPLPVGEVGIVDGPTMAGCDIFGITLRGVGGHGGIPDKAIDPIVAGAQIVTALQTIVSRNVNPLDTAVVSVTMFHAGEADNVIPPQAELRGTFRTFRPQTRDLVERRIREIAGGIATSMGCEATVECTSLTPAVYNDPATTQRLRQAFKGTSDTNGDNGHNPIRLLADVQTMAAEDMAVFLEKIPGTFLLVGSSNAGRELNYPHHHPRFDFDEDVLPIATGLLATAVADYVLRE